MLRRRANRISFASCFNVWKVKRIEKYIGAIQDAIEKLAGRKVDFPEAVLCMTPEDVEYAQSEGAFGMGMYVLPNGGPKVKLNPKLSAWELLMELTHEWLHHTFPTYTEEEIDSLTDEVMSMVFGR